MLSFLGELGFKQGRIKIFEDSTVCISMATSDTISAAHKALKVKYHWVRERVRDETFELVKVDTSEQHADHFTKALGYTAFTEHVKFTMGET